MTPHSLFTIVLKIMGISVLIDALTVIPQSISTGISVGQGFAPNNLLESLVALALILFAIGVYCFGIWVFLFKTDFIINKLSLDKHFIEERFEINIHRSTILPITIIVVGCLIIIHAFPLFCKRIFDYLQQKGRWGQGFDNPNLGWIIYHLVELFFGYQLILKNRKISNWIELRRRKTE